MLFRRLAALALTLSLSAGFTATIPRRSPEYAIYMMDGSQLLLSQYRGKAVCLAFILTTCPHCQHTIQILSKLQKEYGPRGFQAVATAIEDMAKMNVPDFIKNFRPSFPVGYSLRGTVDEYLQHPTMLTLMMPNLVFIDRQGNIRAQYAGDDPFFVDDATKNMDQERNIREQIEKILKNGTTPTSQKTARKTTAAQTKK